MWFPMLLLAVMASGSACPDFCKCISPRIECHGQAPQREDYESLSFSVEELALRDVTVVPKRIERICFVKDYCLGRLRTLEVTNCSNEVTNDYVNTVMHLLRNFPRSEENKMQMLNLSHSNMRNFDFQDVPKIRVIDASHNRFLYDIKFQDKPEIIWLNLSDNDLRYLKPRTFENCSQLEELNLSNNKLDALNGSLAGLYSLLRLNLAGNKLMHVEDSWFKDLGKLFELDLSRNKLTFVPADALRPLVSLAVLKLAENPLIERDMSLLLSTGRRFEIVDASRVGLSRVPAVLTASVRTLKLGGNQLTSIDSGELDSYPLLRLLDLSYNRLTIVEDDALGRLDGLEELILTGNILPQIPRSLPSGLRIFDLRQNAVSRLTANDLQGLYLLRELNLSGNVIEFIEGGSFRQLPALQSLDISDNPIKTLPSDALSGPTNLVHLRMSGLMSLEIEKNRNQDTAFPILAPERLVRLDVSRSPTLAALLLADSAALSACKSLQELDLSYAKISVLRSDLTYILPQLRKLSLIGNQWNCSHDQFWLGEWIRQHADSSKYSARCVTPTDLEGSPLQNLPSSQTTTPKETVVKWETKITTANTSGRYSFTIDKDLNKSKDNMAEPEHSTETSKVTHTNNITESQVIIINGQEMINTTPTSAPPTNYVKKQIRNSQGKVIIEENASTILSTTSHKPEQSINVVTNENLADVSTTTKHEEHTSKIVPYKPVKNYEQRFTNANIESNEETNMPISTTTNVESTSPTSDIANSRITEDFSTFTSTPQVTEEITTITSTTTSIPSTTSIVTTNKPFTSPVTTSIIINVGSTTKPRVVESTTGELVIEPELPASMTLEDIKLRLIRKHQKLLSTSRSKKTAMSQTSSQLLHSKLLLANDESRSIKNNEDEQQPSSIAEELNSQATESGARTAAGESLASGTHPGMLVLLGAAIGAAAALTVVLSRRATAKRRGGDHQRYQRHENIEVHALTPTQELW